MDTENSLLQFKSSKKKRCVRRRNSSESSSSADDGGEHKDILQETLELQKLRKRAHGVNAVTLAIGKKISKMDELVNNDSDPFKLMSGGLLTLDGARKAAAYVAAEDGVGDDEKIVGTIFSKETRIRDEDEEMKKFIESEVEKRRGKPEEKSDQSQTYVSPEDRALLSLPEYLRKSELERSEEMLSSQMLSGIPEVDLGIEEKIRNIEATEAAKKIAAEERAKGKSRPSEFVPTNLAVNFKQPNRFKTEVQVAPKEDKGKKETITQRTVVVGQMPVERVVNLGKTDGSVSENDPMRATDDVHVQKFKKHFQRK